MEVEVATVANPDKTYKSTVQSVDQATSTLTDNEYSESVSNTSQFGLLCKYYFG